MMINRLRNNDGIGTNVHVDYDVSGAGGVVPDSYQLFDPIPYPNSYIKPTWIISWSGANISKNVTIGVLLYADDGANDLALRVPIATINPNLPNYDGDFFECTNAIYRDRIIPAMRLIISNDSKVDVFPFDYIRFLGIQR